MSGVFQVIKDSLSGAAGQVLVSVTSNPPGLTRQTVK